MKKKQLQHGLLVLGIFVAGTAFAQTDSTQSDKKAAPVTRTYLDLLLNLVSTNFNYGKSNSDLSDYKKSTLGAQVGVSFQAGITPNLSLVSEFYFIMKGGQLKENNPLTTAKSTLRFYALELPVLARFNIGKFYTNAGPAFTYNVYGTRKTEGSTEAVSFNNSDEGFKRVDAGIQVGAGYRFNVRQKSIVLDVRYTYGLLNASNEYTQYNRYLNISLHFTKPWKSNPLARK